MKKRIILVALLFASVAGLFAENVNSKNGYFKLKWGSSVEDAKKAGYKLTPIDGEAKSVFQNSYTQPVDFYSVATTDKNVKFVLFSYYMGKFFSVSESILWDGTQKKLESRYGNFRDNGIVALDEGSFMDATLGADGTVKNLSIMISKEKDGSTMVLLFDWAIFKNISVVGRELSGQTETSIVDQLSELAGKLIQPGKNGTKPSYAFLALSTDNKNSVVENYVTDALTEAAFNTGKIKIFERANLEKILSEQKFQASGLVNEDTAKAIGNIAGVDYVCYGTLKDLGDQITINARVVDVETGEICAMSRDTVDKDDYLKQNLASASSPAAKTSAKPAAAPKKTVNTLWTVRKSRNEFDGYTTYTFILKGPQENKFILFGYDKNDVESKSVVRAGFSWDKYVNTTYGIYEIKTNDGNKVSKKFSDARWSYDTGWKDGKEKFLFSYNKGESPRFMLDLIQSNDFLIVRHNDVVQRFQTAGFWDFVEAQGITKQEIENAIANEEF